MIKLKVYLCIHIFWYFERKQRFAIILFLIKRIIRVFESLFFLFVKFQEYNCLFIQVNFLSILNNPRVQGRKERRRTVACSSSENHLRHDAGTDDADAAATDDDDDEDDDNDDADVQK